MISQVQGEFQAKEPQLQQYLAKLKELIRKFEECTMEYFSREQHARADLLSKLASTTTMANNKPVIQEIIEEPSISPAFPFSICSTEQGKDWQQPILEYLAMGKLPKEEKEAKAMKQMVSFYTIMAGELYR